MFEISVALVIIACIAGFLANKYMDQKFTLNSKPAIDAGTVAALEERINKFDQRINDTWGNISSTKQELEAFKLQMGLKGMNNNAR